MSKPTKAELDCRVTLGQTTWWRNRDGIYLLVDRMDDGYRHNVANWLMDHAAAILIPAWRSQEIRRASGEFASPYDDEVPMRFEAKSFWDRYRDRMDKGEHINTMLASPLYRRMAA